MKNKQRKERDEKKQNREKERITAEKQYGRAEFWQKHERLGRGPRRRKKGIEERIQEEKEKQKEKGYERRGEV